MLNLSLAAAAAICAYLCPSCCHMEVSQEGGFVPTSCVPFSWSATDALLHRLLNRRHWNFSAFLIYGRGCSQVKGCELLSLRNGLRLLQGGSLMFSENTNAWMKRLWIVTYYKKINKHSSRTRLVCSTFTAKQNLFNNYRSNIFWASWRNLANESAEHFMQPKQDVQIVL